MTTLLYAIAAGAGFTSAAIATTASFAAEEAMAAYLRRAAARLDEIKGDMTYV